MTNDPKVFNYLNDFSKKLNHLEHIRDNSRITKNGLSDIFIILVSTRRRVSKTNFWLKIIVFLGVIQNILMIIMLLNNNY